MHFQLVTSVDPFHYVFLRDYTEDKTLMTDVLQYKFADELEKKTRKHICIRSEKFGSKLPNEKNMIIGVGNFKSVEVYCDVTILQYEQIKTIYIHLCKMRFGINPESRFHLDILARYIFGVDSPLSQLIEPEQANNVFELVEKEGISIQDGFKRLY